MNIAVVLRGWRKAEGLSVREAAHRAGVDKMAWSRIERGMPISQANFAAVVCWLFSWS
ncbi:MAG: helix-turn-helix transcriptional regulator [Terracidiphilus sp.]